MVIMEREVMVPDWMVLSSMTLSDPNPGFKANISKTVRFRDKVAEEN